MENKKLNPVLFASINTSDLDMITMKTMKSIKAADIIVMDCFHKSKIQRFTKKSAKIIHLSKKRLSDEEEHRSHILTIIDIIEKNYMKGKKVVRIVDMDSFLSKHIHTEFRLLKFRNIDSAILPEPGVDYFSTDKTKKVSFFSINCDIRNADSLWYKITDNFQSGQSILLYSSIDIYEQFNFFINNNKSFCDAKIDIFDINNLKPEYNRNSKISEISSAVYFIGH